MTREELIARIEAGETGAEMLVALVKELQFTVYVNLDDALHFGATYDYFIHAGIPDWLHSFDASVALLGELKWSVDCLGHATLWRIDERYIFEEFGAHIPINPAAALVAAWLKATT